LAEIVDLIGDVLSAFVSEPLRQRHQLGQMFDRPKKTRRQEQQTQRGQHQNREDLRLGWATKSTVPHKSTSLPQMELNDVI
jgi:hypothetical protein